MVACLRMGFLWAACVTTPGFDQLNDCEASDMDRGSGRLLVALANTQMIPIDSDE